MKSGTWISIGALLLAASFAIADDLKEIPQGPNPWPPCPPACDPCCPSKAANSNAVCPTPQKIVVHQAAPIVEFRDDAPAGAVASTARPRTLIEDRAVRPVGDLLHHGGDCGCNGSGNFYKTKTKNYFQGVGTFGGTPMQYAPQTALASVPLQVQAYVPTAVQTYSVAAMPTFAAPAAVSSFGFTPSAAMSMPASLSLAAPNTNVDATTLALAQLFSAAANAPPPAASRAASAATAASTGALEERVTALELKVQGIDARLKRIETKLQTFCAP